MTRKPEGGSWIDARALIKSGRQQVVDAAIRVRQSDEQRAALKTMWTEGVDYVMKHAKTAHSEHDRQSAFHVRRDYLRTPLVPTEDADTYLQLVGRHLRFSPGKDDTPDRGIVVIQGLIVPDGSGIIQEETEFPLFAFTGRRSEYPEPSVEPVHPRDLRTRVDLSHADVMNAQIIFNRIVSSRERLQM